MYNNHYSEMHSSLNVTAATFDRHSYNRSVAAFEIYPLELMISLQGNLPERVNKMKENFEILWIRTGSGSISIDFAKYELEQNKMYFIAPGQSRDCNMDSSMAGYYISFSPEFVFLAETYFEPSLVLTGYKNSSAVLKAVEIDHELQGEMEEILKKMCKEFSDLLKMRTEILKGLLNVFLLYSFRSMSLQDDDLTFCKDSNVVRKFFSLLKKHYTTKRMVADYATELYLTPNSLNRIIKKATGFPARHHIQQQIILEAKRQAIYSGISMKQTAYALGFDNIAHFSKFFKNNSGMSFTDFKRSKADLFG